MLHLGHHHHRLQRHRNGPVGDGHPHLLQRGHLPAAEGDPVPGAHRGLHRGHRGLCDHRGPPAPGLCPGHRGESGRVHPPDRGQLHHPGPGGVLRVQEQDFARGGGRPLPGHRLHAGAGGHERYPGAGGHRGHRGDAVLPRRVQRDDADTAGGRLPHPGLPHRPDAVGPEQGR